MTDLADLVSAGRVLCNPDITSKKRALELLGSLMAIKGLRERDIFDSLVSRERLGSTGLGQGIALPHGRLAQANQAIGAFIKLKRGIDFDAPDQQPVDLVFGLIVPDYFINEHLMILAQLADMFQDKAFCALLRSTDDNAQLFEHLLQWHPTSPVFSTSIL